MRIAFVGCGFAADFYATTLKSHPQLELVGCFDKNEERTTKFSHTYSIHAYKSLGEILNDVSISIIVNLTAISDHYTVTKACLQAGKHVFSEKPLSTNLLEATELVELAREKSLQISCAPANLLGEAAQTTWKLLRSGILGKVWLVYAELDDGAIHLMNYRGWLSRSGFPWPLQSEFEMGCTLEHAEYYIGWLTAFFGPARKVISFVSCLVPDKLEKETQVPLGDDISVSCITFSSGVVARLTCSTLAPKDHSLTIVGSEGVLTVEDCWLFESPIYIQERLKSPFGNTYLSEKREVKLEKLEKKRITYGNMHDMDFARGIAELADAVQQQRSPRLSAQHALHITEILTCITNTIEPYHEVKSSFPPIAPMQWAEDD